MKNKPSLATVIRQVAFTTAIAVVLTACGVKEKEQLRTEVDSLRNELKTSQKMAETLNEISVLIDSIDANRNSIRVSAVEGIQKDDYVNRMEGLKNYVSATKDKIEQLEGELKKSKSSNRAFYVAIKKLKSDIESRNLEIASLTESLNHYKADNESLVKITEEQVIVIENKKREIETGKQEIASLVQKVDEVSTQAKATEAEGYLARAKAVEEAANRTKLAPKKKKATLNESLELYRKALSLGNTEAKTEIQRLESGLK
jgi:chromosome segregation ATPase